MHRFILAAFLLFATGLITDTFGQSSGPQISAVASTTARAGDQIVISGSNFGSSQGSGNVWLGSTYGTVASWSDSQVIAAVASGSQTGVAQILQSGVWSNPVNLTVITPNITSVTPTTAIAGTQITIAGTGFGANQGSGNVWLGSTYGVVVSWSDTQVVANVASGSKSGVAQILQGGVWSNSINLTVSTPNITSVTPTTAIAGTQITITGTGFGASQGSGNIWLGSTYGVVVSWSDTQVVANVASGSKSGVAQILQGGVWSNTVNLTVSTPNITSVTPTTAIAGTQITITGTGFGVSQSGGNVWLGSTYGVVVSWSDTQIIANVASGSSSGVAQVLQGGVWSNSVSLTVVTPNITSVSPSSGNAGTQITVTGTGFGATQGTGNVWLGSTYGVVVSWTDTQVVATVASGSNTGVAQILQGGVWSNSVNFAVTSLNLASLTPASAPIGAPVTITGSGFGAIQDVSTVSFNGTIARAQSWSDTKIVGVVSNGTTSGPVSVTVGGVASNSLNFAVTAPPSITSVSPASGMAGTQVSVTGSGFGSAQGSGTVQLGSRPGVAVSWSDTQIIATVATGSVSGNAQVRQSGVGSNSVAFTVITATITGVSPTSGAVGAQVTITGSGFGSAQGAGQVSLGTAPAQVTGWSDTQVVASVAAGSTSGAAQILQNGVWSNPVAFTVTGGAPHITSSNPNTGSAGTVVTIQGTGFGSSQGSGIASIGTQQASVNSWSDTQVSATVAAGAISGIVKIQQNGLWSNAVTFTVPLTSGSGGQITLNPNAISMVVGDTQSIQALSSNSQPVTGLSWTSSDTTIVTLSTDDPPVLAAVAPGNATITAGGASADVTVYPGSTLPLGTIVWSNPGDGSGVDAIFPAVPGYTGVADVFALQGDGTIQAITTDGGVAWAAAPAGGFGNSYLPDFQGGLVVFGSGTSNNSDTSILRLDGLTGQPYPAYVTTTNEGMFSGLEYPAIHTDGTIFTVDYACLTACSDPQLPPDTTDGAWVVGIDPSTGGAKFKVQLANQVSQGQTDAFCSAGGLNTYFIHPWPYSLMIAGDGFLYTSYVTEDSVVNTKKSPLNVYPDAAYNDFDALGRDVAQSNFSAAIGDLTSLWNDIGQSYDPNDPLLIALQNSDKVTAVSLLNNMSAQFRRLCDSTTNLVTKMHLLRVGTDGSSSDVVADQWTTNSSLFYTPSGGNPYYQQQRTQSGPSINFNNVQLITNADQGAVYSWQALMFCESFQTNCQGGTENHLTNVTGGALAADVIWDAGGYQPSTPVLPILQLQDGSYIGSVNSGSQGLMMAFDASGGVRWAIPNYSPSMATADGGIIATSGGSYDPISGTFVSGTAVTFDANANATGQLGSLPTFSWKGAYLLGSIESEIPLFDLANIAPTFASVPGGNLTGNGFSLRHHSFGLVFCNTGRGGDGPCPSTIDIANMSFSYLAGISDSNYTSACDFSISSACDSNVAHPEWVNTIKIQALNAYADAFKNLPAIVSSKQKTTILNGGSKSPDNFEHTAYVDGTWFSNEGPGCPHFGLTKSGSFNWVFYLSAMCAAQRNLGSYGNSPNFTPPFSDTANFQRLVIAIGKGIGNVAAHETGHQISFSPFKLVMDCGPGSPSGTACENGVNSVYEAAETGAWAFIDWTPPIHWQPSDVKILEQYFTCTAKGCN